MRSPRTLGATLLGFVTAAVAATSGASCDVKECTLMYISSYGVTLTGVAPADLVVTLINWDYLFVVTITASMAARPCSELPLRLDAYCCTGSNEIHCAWGGMGAGTLLASGTGVVPIRVDLEQLGQDGEGYCPEETALASAAFVPSP